MKSWLRNAIVAGCLVVPFALAMNDAPAQPGSGETGITDKSAIVENSPTPKTKRPAAKRGANNSAVAGPRATTAAPLTAQECKNLGGVVLESASCTLGKTCSTTSPSGGVRLACITER